MKKPILLISFTLFLININAQTITTLDFESWENGEPSGWFTSNVLNVFVPITQSTDAHSGMYAIKGTVVQGPNGGYPPLMAAGLNGRGMPINIHALVLQGWFKFSSDSSDAFVMAISVRKNGKTIGSGGYFSNQVQAAYTKFEAGINYSSGNSEVIPDTAQITVAISSSQFHTGSTFYLDDISFGVTTGVNDESNSKGISYKLNQNYPNPFNPGTVISYSLAEPGFVKLKVYNMLGEDIRTLVNGNLDAGEHSVQFDASGLPSGIYIYKIEAGSFVEIKKLMLLK